MTIDFNSDTNLARSEHAVCSKVGEETVILHLENGTYYGLDSLGTRVWDILENSATANGICQTLLPVYEVSADVLSADITTFLVDMAKNDLIQIDPESQEASSGQ